MTTQRDLRRDTDPLSLRALGAVRRLAIAFTSKVLWQLTGARMPDGVETIQAEVFSGIGFFSRPSSSGRPEAVSVNLGADAKTPVVVATRDEATRQKSAGELAEDETAIFNTQSLVYVKADGTIEARTVGGTALPLATKADLDAVIEYLKRQFDPNAGHVHPPPNLPTQPTPVTESSIIPPAPGAGTCPAAAGTSKLKGE
jgi:hypothetical protein